VEEFGVADLKIREIEIWEWYALHDGVCPNCGLDLGTQFPDTNVWPHWTGDCSPEENPFAN
jgi:hypothetical protein